MHVHVHVHVQLHVHVMLHASTRRDDSGGPLGREQRGDSRGPFARGGGRGQDSQKAGEGARTLASGVLTQVTLGGGGGRDAHGMGITEVPSIRPPGTLMRGVGWEWRVGKGGVEGYARRERRQMHALSA